MQVVLFVIFMIFAGKFITSDKLTKEARMAYLIAVLVLMAMLGHVFVMSVLALLFVSAVIYYCREVYRSVNMTDENTKKES